MTKVAILGFGTVGSGVAEVLSKNSQGIARRSGGEIQVKYILDVRDFPDSPFKDCFVKDFSIIENDPEVDVVVETKRGHRLGRIIREGSAIPDTGIPGIIGGYGKERVIHAGTAGIFMDLRKIGDIVEAGETIAQIRTADGAMISVTTQITGILRGLLRSSYPVTPGFKVADIDPRKEELSNCFLISDKARCIAGSVLELVCAQLWK